MKIKYEKYKDESGKNYYEMMLPNGNRHIVKQELGDYVHQLEQKLRIGFPDEIEVEELLRNQQLTREK